MLCKICGVEHPEFQLAYRVKCAEKWYEKTGEKTVVFISLHGYDFTVLSDPNLPQYTQVFQVPGGWVQ